MEVNGKRYPLWGQFIYGKNLLIILCIMCVVGVFSCSQNPDNTPPTEDNIIVRFTLENALNGKLDSVKLHPNGKPYSITEASAIGIYKCYRGLGYTQKKAYLETLNDVAEVLEQINKDDNNNYQTI